MVSDEVGVLPWDDGSLPKLVHQEPQVFLQQFQLLHIHDLWLKAIIPPE